MKMEYTIQIKQNPESGWFIGQCEEVPEAITQGKDMDELMFMMQDAIEMALECRRDEFRQQYADENALVRKLIIGHEKKFVHQTPERKELHTV
jgi:predicted RNase H-like HicB family nuclease